MKGIGLTQWVIASVAELSAIAENRFVVYYVYATFGCWLIVSVLTPSDRDLFSWPLDGWLFELDKMLDDKSTAVNLWATRHRQLRGWVTQTLKRNPTTAQLTHLTHWERRFRADRYINGPWNYELLVVHIINEYLKFELIIFK